MRLCSLPGSTLASSIQREYARTVKLVERESRESCVQALLDGDLDALTADDAVLAGLASQPEFTGKARLADRWGPEFSYAVGLNRSDLGLCSRVSVALQAMVDDGSWARAVKEHLAHGGYTPIRGNPPAANLCN